MRAARTLLRGSDRGALATILSGAPYASLVLVAADLDASPVLLLSDLAQATRNLKADPRVSLLLSAVDSVRDPLDSPRLSLLGSMEMSTEPRHRRRYLARQPQSGLYADFADFNFYRIAIKRAHYVGGFGKIAWIDARDLLVAEPARGLEHAELALAQWLSRDCRAELDLCASRLAGCEGAGWQAAGVDPDGIDLCRDDRVARLEFRAPASGEVAFRTAFAALVEAARRAPAG